MYQNLFQGLAIQYPQGFSILPSNIIKTLECEDNFLDQLNYRTNKKNKFNKK